ncbi:MAG: TonB-dependent receptor [Marinilabiliales bacterium]|nr:MAG: TonB-dependent receptor [Marinilabiliales bacterium]
MKLIIWCILMCLSIWAFPQTIIKVFDRETREPIDLVSITCEKPDVFAVTNANGEADVSAFYGCDHYVLRALGYKTRVIDYDMMRELSGKVFLERNPFNLDEVVISGTRSDQLSSEVPLRIKSISKTQVAEMNPQTAADLLAVSGSVYIQKSQQGGGSPMIRGFATNRLLYVVDGIRMNTAIFRSGNIQNVISLDPFAIEKTEVLFGPGSVVYGSDAIGGVMSFQTMNPQFSISDKPFVKGSAIMRYSTANNEKTYHFDVNAGWKKLALLTSFSSNNYGDLIMGSNGPDEYLRPFFVMRMDSTDVLVNNANPKVQNPSGYTQLNFMQKLRYSPSDKWDIQYGFHYSETSSYSRYDRHIRYKNGLPRYGEWYYGPQKWMMNNLSVTSYASTCFYQKMTLRIAQQSFEESRISRDFNKNDRETRIENVEAYSANLDFVKFISEKNKLIYGAEFVTNDVRSTGINEDISTGVVVDGPSRYPQATWQSFGFFLNDIHELSDKVKLIGSVRYSSFGIDAVFDTTFYPFPFTNAEMSNSAITGSFGFIVRPNEKWIVSMNGATAFRSPNVDDMGKVFDSEPGSVVVPNPNLEAEYAYNADFGVTKVFGDFMEVEVSAFYTYLQNALVRRDYTMNGLDSIFYDGTLSQVQAIQNAAFANVYGFQADLEIELMPGLDFGTNLNWQKGEEELDDGSTSPSRHAAPFFGRAKLSYRTGKLKMMFYVHYSAEVSYEDMPVEEVDKDYMYAINDEGNPYSPSWYTLNFKARYQLNKNLSVAAGLENITDIRYRPYSSGIVAPGRNLIFSLRADF